LDIILDAVMTSQPKKNNHMTRSEQLKTHGLDKCRKQILIEYETLFEQQPTMTITKAIRTLSRRWKVPVESIKEQISEHANI